MSESSDPRDQNPHEAGTPQWTLHAWLESWKARDWKRMLSHCQLGWKAMASHDTTWLEGMLGRGRLVWWEIVETKLNSSQVFAIVTVRVRIGSDLETSTEEAVIRPTVIRESAAGKARADGHWGVNPISALKGLSQQAGQQLDIAGLAAQILGRR